MYRTYTPDFVLPNGIILETKGQFISDDRRKHKLIKQQHPDLDIRFVFTNSKSKLSRGQRQPTAFGVNVTTFCTQIVFHPCSG